MENINVNVKSDETVTGLLDIFLIPAIFMWTMPGLATIIPALSALCAFGYWQWVGTMIVIRYVCRLLGKILHK